jgi:hypothetical protein
LEIAPSCVCVWPAATSGATAACQAAATTPSAPASSKERLAFLGRHLLQPRAKRLALIVVPAAAFATCTFSAGGRRPLAIGRRRVGGSVRGWSTVARLHRVG